MKNLITLLIATMIGSLSYAQCVADFSFANNDPTVQFFESSTYSGTPDFYWDFGDGNSSTAANPSHTYQYNGVYSICLSVIDSSTGCYDVMCDSLYIGNANGLPCDASFYTSTSANTVYLTNTSTGSYTDAYVYWGDGGSWELMTGGTIQHTYATSGTYYITLGLDDGSGLPYGCDSTGQYETVFGSSGGCTADMYVSENNGVITGTDQSSGAASTEWFIWDSNWNLVHNSTNSNLSYTANSNGTYNICLYAYDSTGNWCDSVCTYLTVGSGTSACNADFWSVDSAQYTYFFNNSQGSNLNYFWDFGDGNTSTLENPVHYYSTPGTYTVCLTVWNGTNCSDTTCNTIVVNPAASSCTADFIWFLDSAFNGSSTNTVYVFNLAQGNNLSYYWDFGDGNSSTQQYPTHQYAQNGTYYVCLTVSDNSGCIDTYCDSISYTQRQSGFYINVTSPSGGTALDVELFEMEVSELYPNPASEMINFSVTTSDAINATVVVTDMLGKRVVEKPLGYVNGSSKVNLDISHLEAGMYTLTIRSDNGQASSRFIVR